MLSIQGLHKNYASKQTSLQVLKDISLEVQQGEFVSIMGKSGCGKTTLLNILGLIDDFEQGQYILDGQDATGLSAAQKAKLRGEKIGFVFQSYQLLQELTVRDNISVPMGYAGAGKKQRDARAAALLELVGLPDKAKQLPSQLSGGQQQRVAIARALSNRPSILLADEPTGNLDSKNGQEVMALLQKLNTQGVTIVMVTHDSEFSHLAHRALYMKDGVFV